MQHTADTDMRLRQPSGCPGLLVRAAIRLPGRAWDHWHNGTDTESERRSEVNAKSLRPQPVPALARLRIRYSPQYTTGTVGACDCWRLRVR